MLPGFWGMMRGGGELALKGALNLSLTVFVVASVGALLLMAAARWLAVAGGLAPAREETAA
jgi:hypothetical protein